jgi:hypothetical protein
MALLSGCHAKTDGFEAARSPRRSRKMSWRFFKDQTSSEAAGKGAKAFYAMSELSCVDRRPSPPCGRPFGFHERGLTRIKIEPKKLIECVVGYSVVTTVFALDDQSVEITGGGIFYLTPTDWAVHF